MTSLERVPRSGFYPGPPLREVCGRGVKKPAGFSVSLGLHWTSPAKGSLVFPFLLLYLWVAWSAYPYAVAVRFCSGRATFTIDYYLRIAFTSKYVKGFF
jgi:hypothetical protein